MKTNEHNIFAWLMLLAALSAVVACFVLRHLQDTGTMKPLQYGLLVYACVVVVVTLVALVKHLPTEIKRNSKRTNRETEEDKCKKKDPLWVRILSSGMSDKEFNDTFNLN